MKKIMIKYLLYMRTLLHVKFKQKNMYNQRYLN